MYEGDCYLVHIDIVQGASSKAIQGINRHMIECCSFDPRRCLQFPYHLKDQLSAKQKMKLAGGLSDNYYELWQVHKNYFKLEDFQKMVAELPRPKTTTKKQQFTTIVRISFSVNGICTVNVYESQQ